MSRQICRLWLKHNFLGLGGACPSGASSVACTRKHEIPSNVNLLYKDYSFKGLSAAQRKTIIAKAASDGTSTKADAFEEKEQEMMGKKEEEKGDETSGGQHKSRSKKRKEKKRKRDSVSSVEKPPSHQKEEAKIMRKEKS